MFVVVALASDKDFSISLDISKFMYISHWQSQSEKRKLFFQYAILFKDGTLKGTETKWKSAVFLLITTYLHFCIISSSPFAILFFPLVSDFSIQNKKETFFAFSQSKHIHTQSSRIILSNGFEASKSICSFILM